nr:hypothetical protein GCM10025699_34710 [Microbacterium flavescens]
MREFVLARTDPQVVREVLRRHADWVTVVSERFIARARTDASKEAMGLSVMLCPEVNAALRWSLAERDPVAVRLSALLAVGVEQYGSDADSVEALAMGAHDEWLLERATPSQLLALGNALAFFDIEVVGRLAGRALAVADPVDPQQQRAAHQLAGLAAAYGSQPAAALPHLEIAERLAVEQDDPWDAAAARQFRGVALRSIAVQEGRRSDVADAVEAFEAAMRGYARAGDETHVNNVRFMMALTAPSPATTRSALRAGPRNASRTPRRPPMSTSSRTVASSRRRWGWTRAARSTSCWPRFAISATCGACTGS